MQSGAANLLLQLADQRYEKQSTIVTTNIGFEEWLSILFDEGVASDIVDRLLHHATVIFIMGAYRLKACLARA